MSGHARAGRYADAEVQPAGQLDDLFGESNGTLAVTGLRGGL